VNPKQYLLITSYDLVPDNLIVDKNKSRENYACSLTFFYCQEKEKKTRFSRRMVITQVKKEQIFVEKTRSKY
jgi:hypothetical protein